MTEDKGRLPAKRSEVQNFLAKVRAIPPTTMSGQGRLLFGLDATMSRQPLWDQASQLHAQMFLESGKDASLLVQLAYYRGLHDFQHSGWVQNPQELLTEMTGIRCYAGHTQIGRLLNHILKESRSHKVNAAVFVGDAIEESAETLFKLAGQLNLLGTPLFVFQEGFDPEVEQVFRRIAQLSGGAYCHFDAGSVEQLRLLMGAAVKYATGGMQALKRLAQQSDTAQSRKALELMKQLPGPKK